jgi:hypothetical protein
MVDILFRIYSIPSYILTLIIVFICGLINPQAVENLIKKINEKNPIDIVMLFIFHLLVSTMAYHYIYITWLS